MARRISILCRGLSEWLSKVWCATQPLHPALAFTVADRNKELRMLLAGFL